MWTSQTSRPSRSTRLGSMFTTMHWLPNRRAAAADELGVADGGRVDRDLVGPGVQQGPDVVEVADAAADGDAA